MTWHRDNFTSSFSSKMAYFSCIMALARTSSTMLKSFWPFTIACDSICAFIVLIWIPPILIYWAFSLWKNAFYVLFASIEMNISVSSFIFPSISNPPLHSYSSPFKKKKRGFYLFTYLKVRTTLWGGVAEPDSSSIHCCVSKGATVAIARPSQSHEPGAFPSSPTRMQGPRHLGLPLLLF